LASQTRTSIRLFSAAEVRADSAEDGAVEGAGYYYPVKNIEFPSGGNFVVFDQPAAKNSLKNVPWEVKATCTRNFLGLFWTSVAGMMNPHVFWPGALFFSFNWAF
jgi:hypothetical protein